MAGCITWTMVLLSFIDVRQNSPNRCHSVHRQGSLICADAYFLRMPKVLEQVRPVFFSDIEAGVQCADAVYPCLSQHVVCCMPTIQVMKGIFGVGESKLIPSGNTCGKPDIYVA